MENKAKLCQLKDKYYLLVYKLRKKAKILQEKLNNLAYNYKTLDYDPIVDLNNKDNSQLQSYIFW